MHRVVVKADRRDISFRVTIPRKIIQQKGWNNVEYMILEESGPEKIVLRRFIDKDALDQDPQSSLFGFN